MGTRLAARKVLWWTVRTSTSTVFTPHCVAGRCLLSPPQHTRSRLLCSSSRQVPLQTPALSHTQDPLPGKAATDLSLRCLVEIGFTDTQAEDIYEDVSKLRGSAAKHTLSTLTTLINTGFTASSVLKLLMKCPQLYTVKESQLQQRVAYLRKLGLVEGSLQRMVSSYPQILTVPLKTVKQTVLFLKERCLFTTQQVTAILRDSPATVVEDEDQLEYKFQYVYFRMGIKQADMVKSRLFRFTLDEVRHRHGFLERRGFYETPDKRGQTSIANPKLEAILSCEEENFLSQVAKASAEEYDVFKRLMARELQEDEYGNVEADSDDEDNEEGEEDEDDEDEADGKSGYRKTRRRRK